jgi:hypothetical protein
MTESNQVNRALREHLGPFGRMLRVEHRLEIGWPDWHYTLRGVSGWIEAKLFPRSGRAPEAFTLDQLIWGEEEIRAGGRWTLLGRRGDEWVAYDAPGARALFDGRSNAPLFALPGPFPVRAALDVLAPRDANREPAGREVRGFNRWRHKKRGSTYTEIGRGKLQSSYGVGTLEEGLDMVVYRDDVDGSLWIRAADEFEDGRFERL